ncbi:hypothetical protein EV122DRAFT_278484 [Schizophyllum commune]
MRLLFPRANASDAQATWGAELPGTTTVCNTRPARDGCHATAEKRRQPWELGLRVLLLTPIFLSAVLEVADSAQGRGVIKRD